jgi:hypothetical protein
MLRGSSCVSRTLADNAVVRTLVARSLRRSRLNAGYRKVACLRYKGKLDRSGSLGR